MNIESIPWWFWMGIFLINASSVTFGVYDLATKDYDFHTNLPAFHATTTHQILLTDEAALAPIPFHEL